MSQCVALALTRAAAVDKWGQRSNFDIALGRNWDWRWEPPPGPHHGPDARAELSGGVKRTRRLGCGVPGSGLAGAALTLQASPLLALSAAKGARAVARS